MTTPLLLDPAGPAFKMSPAARALFVEFAADAVVCRFV
jgi:hypothetical protein